jgi:hypothetical protein
MGRIFAILVSRIALILLTITSVSMMVVTAIAGSQPRFDPFGEYADIMPGQSQDALSERGFNCQFKLIPTFEEICSLIPEMRIFSEIQVRLVSNPSTGRVSQTIFKLPEDRLTYGDLVLLWGKPQIIIYGQTANLRWHTSHIIAILQTNNHHFSYWTPIPYVAFEAAH